MKGTAADKRSQRGHTSYWQLQDAKARFSEVVRRAVEQGPQHVTVNGEERAVIVSAREYDVGFAFVVSSLRPLTAPMRYLFADSEPFPLEYDFLATRSPASSIAAV